MNLSFSQKRIFYYELAQLLRSGVPFPKAIRTVSKQSSRRLREFLSRLTEAVERGATISQAFEAQRPVISHLETSVITACERGGRLEQGCRYLTGYFEMLQQSKGAILRKSAYPLFLLHFGVFALAIPKLMSSGLGAYLEETLGFLVVFYACCALLAVACLALIRLGSSSRSIDSLLNALPVFGKLRRAFSLARFCATYEIQLDSGVNVLDSLTGAAQASRSALVTHAIQRALPEVRRGSQVGPLLEKASVFPPAVIGAFRLGEETGALHEELRRVAEELQREAATRLETVTEWLPKLLYIAIAVYVGMQIVSFYKNILGGYQNLLG